MTGDELWVHHFTPETKTISMAWTACPREVQNNSLCRRFGKKRFGLLRSGILFLDDNARPHSVMPTQNHIAVLGWEHRHHPPYSPDLAPSDIHLFPSLKKNLALRSFGSNAAVKQAEQRIFFEAYQEDEGFDLSALLQFLHLKSVVGNELLKINSHKLCHYSPPPQDRTKIKAPISRTTHEATPSNRVHFRAHSFPTPWEKVEPRNRKCLYCNKGHELDACRSFSANEKREILRKKRCCYLCLSPGHRAMECVKREWCPICNGSHHFSICFRIRHDDDLSPKRYTVNTVSAVIKTEVNSVLLQTCAALIDIKNEQEVVRLFLDNGSQRSFVLKSTSEKFNFPILRKENLSICTFGAKETETKTLNIVKIKLKNRDDPNLCIEIEAVETEHISITNLPTPDRNIDKNLDI
ncbi:uncharacterized protein TNCV_3733401 [Trichonephila clavipes]|nr:uncharacterized protein TNCV_3733401 [Trichonephila clavipes]